MKLSQLMAMVEAMNENIVNPDNPDPDVTFWIPRKPNNPPGEKESEFFVEYEMQCAPELIGNSIVSRECGSCRAMVGDFSIPVTEVNFYK